MSYYGYLQQRYLAALVASGQTPASAAETVAAANSGNKEAIAALLAALAKTEGTAQGEIVPEWSFQGVYFLPNNPLQGNTPYQPQDRALFSPLPTNVMSIEGGMVTLIMFKLLRDHPDMFQKIALKYLDSCARIVESVEESCHSNWLTALNNQHIAAGISHRIGLIDDGSYIKIVDHYRSVFDKMWEAQMLGNVLEGIGTFVGQTKITGAAAKGATGGSSSGLAALANILTAKG